MSGHFIYVLLLLTSYKSGAVSHEFIGKESCEHAGRQMEIILGKKNITYEVAWVCVPKDQRYQEEE
jgi:hypothetical protein